MQIIQPKNIFTKTGAEYLIFVDENNIHQELRADAVAVKS